MYNWWTERIGHIKVKDIKAKDLSACKQILLTEISKYGKPRQANTINKYLMCMSAILTYARDELELIEYNPMSKVKIIPKPEGRKRYLTQEELSRYLSACKNHSKAYIRHLWKCGEATAATLLSIHNIKYLVEFSQKCRQAILEDRFGDFCDLYE